MSEQVTSISFFRFHSFRQKLWAFKMMQAAHARLSDIPDQENYKLMGSGKNEGFNPIPDWSTYCLLQTWKNKKAADRFFYSHALFQEYRNRSSEVWTLMMHNIRSHGRWSGVNPFRKSPRIDKSNDLIAVITRARIKTTKLIPFWRYVPTSHQPLKENDGLIYTKGIGEIPILNMATFSLWKNKEALRSYAYNSTAHQVAIEKTRSIDWYKEELFARFQPYKSIGNWSGIESEAFSHIVC